VQKNSSSEAFNTARLTERGLWIQDLGCIHLQTASSQNISFTWTKVGGSKIALISLWVVMKSLELRAKDNVVVWIK
jgi:hypothetical protein